MGNNHHAMGTGNHGDDHHAMGTGNHGDGHHAMGTGNHGDDHHAMGTGNHPTSPYHVASCPESSEIASFPPNPKTQHKLISVQFNIPSILSPRAV